MKLRKLTPEAVIILQLSSMLSMAGCFYVGCGRFLCFPFTRFSCGLDVWSLKQRYDILGRDFVYY